MDVIPPFPRTSWESFSRLSPRQIRLVEGSDDDNSIYEDVARRFRRLYAENELYPDILLIDGGKGQLNAAQHAFRDLDLAQPTLLSAAKREEEIYRPGQEEPLRLNRSSFSLRLLQYVRDVSHRFAQHYHHHLLLCGKSQLDE